MPAVERLTDSAQRLKSGLRESTAAVDRQPQTDGDRFARALQVVAALGSTALVLAVSKALRNTRLADVEMQALQQESTGDRPAAVVAAEALLQRALCGKPMAQRSASESTRVRHPVGSDS